MSQIGYQKVWEKGECKSDTIILGPHKTYTRCSVKALQIGQDDGFLCL